MTPMDEPEILKASTPRMPVKNVDHSLDPKFVEEHRVKFAGKKL